MPKLQVRVGVSLLAVLMLSMLACQSDTPTDTSAQDTDKVHIDTPDIEIESEIRALMTQINEQLATEGAAFRLEVAEWYGDVIGETTQRTVFFSNRGNKQLGHHFVPGDTRRAWSAPGDAISYIIDQTEGVTTSGLTQAQTNAAIDRAMDTWNNIECSTIPLQKFPDVAFDIGLVEFQSGLGGFPGPLADVTHAGWLPAGILSSNVIGVTFTFIFTNGGIPTDIDNNGKLDTALREILYNDIFPWNINAACDPVFCGAGVDVETIALHEAGHGLSQGHFGEAFRNPGNGKLHFNPRAVMNAAYSGVQQAITETDNAGHCSIWSSWPEN